MYVYCFTDNTAWNEAAVAADNDDDDDVDMTTTTMMMCCTLCLQKRVDILFALCRSNMNPFQLKLVCMSWNKHLNKHLYKYSYLLTYVTKLCKRCLLHLRYVLTLPWEIWSERLSRIRWSGHFRLCIVLLNVYSRTCILNFI